MFPTSLVRYYFHYQYLFFNNTEDTVWSAWQVSDGIYVQLQAKDLIVYDEVHFI
jgi:hypothetical protein